MTTIPECILNPPAMNTIHGRPMSPRMARFWAYIRWVRHIQLTDWSTDNGVAAVYAELQAAERDLEAMLPGDTTGAVEDVLKYLHCVMARRPADRVHAAEEARSKTTGIITTDMTDSISLS